MLWGGTDHDNGGQVVLGEKLAVGGSTVGIIFKRPCARPQAVHTRLTHHHSIHPAPRTPIKLQLKLSRLLQGKHTVKQCRRGS